MTIHQHGIIGHPELPAPSSAVRGLWGLIHHQRAALLLLCVSLLFTLGATAVADRTLKESRDAQLHALVTDTVERIATHLHDYEQALRSGSALFASLDRSPTRGEWSAFAGRLDLETEHPGVQGIGFAPLLTPGSVDDFERNTRAEGFPDFRVIPGGNRDAYSTIGFLEPFNAQNRALFGFDLYSDAIARDAMERARDSGRTALSGKVRLQQAAQGAASYNLIAFYPVYQLASAPTSLEERRASLLGYVFTPFVTDELFSGISAAAGREIYLRVYEGSGQHPDALLFTNRRSFPPRAKLRTESVTLTTGGRHWTLDVGTTEDYLGMAAPFTPAWVGAGGTAIHVVLIAVLLGVARQRKVAEDAATRRAREVSSVTAKLEAVRSNAEIGLVQFSLHSDAVTLDDTASVILDFAPGEPVTLPEYLERMHPDDRERLYPEQAATQARVIPETYTFRIHDREGRQRQIKAHVLPEYDSDHAVIGASALICDVTAQTERLGQSLIAQTAWDGISDALVIMDAQLQIVDANPAFSEISGFAKHEVLGKTMRLYKYTDGGRAAYREILRALKRDDSWQGKTWNTKKNGDMFIAHERIWAIRDKEQKISHYVSAMTDLTETVERENRLQAVAHVDHLTGLPNRAQLRDDIQSSMAAAHLASHVMAILFIDLDRFEAVNVRLGQSAGDELLIQVAGRLRSLARSMDHVARIGGDEFALILNDLKDSSQVESHVEHILAGLSGTYTLEGCQKVYMSASIGVSTFPKDNSHCDNLLRHANQAVYVAKERGRNRYEFFDVEKSERDDHERRQIQRLQYALKDNEFVLFYQPKINMRTGAVVGAEALLRWQHPDDGLIPPDRFLPLVAGTPQAAEIDRWVIGEALRQLEIIRASGYELQISVNIDGAYLQQVEFLEDLSSQLEAYPDLPRELLQLEILESTALTDLENITLVIRQCRALGMSVALDDFGTGYSSLTYLKQLPTDTLKIDKSFIIDMLEDNDSLSLVESVIKLASTFGRTVIAEGVETERHGVSLVRMGCELGQGYGIQHPLPASDFMRWLKTQTAKATTRSDNVVWLNHTDNHRA